MHANLKPCGGGQFILLTILFALPLLAAPAEPPTIPVGYDAYLQ